MRKLKTRIDCCLELPNVTAARPIDKYRSNRVEITNVQRLGSDSCAISKSGVEQSHHAGK